MQSTFHRLRKKLSSIWQVKTEKVLQDEVLPDFVHLTCKIEDTGIGIPADKIHMLFKPFSQLDPSSTRNYGGRYFKLFRN
jgi:signal transduction histidine kinase